MIRTGKQSDREAIATFDRIDADRSSELAEGRVMVVVTGGEVVAFATFREGGFFGRPCVDSLTVKPTHHHRGIGRSLIRAVEKRVRSERGGGRVFAATPEKVTALRDFYERGGWSFAGTVRGVRGDDAADCLYFRDLVSA
ncbi:MAG: GNAT family N-acetyltransferase [Planctomycetota bacterium]